jgi:hypothetical protein
MPDTIPESVKGIVFHNIEPPNLLTDYDVLGFEADNCLVKYDTLSLVKTFVQLTLEDLVNNYEGYPKELMQFDFNKHLNVCNNNSVWDIHNGTILKLAEGGVITQAIRGFVSLSQSQIEVLYGTPPKFEQLKWPEKNSLELANPKAYLTIMGQFEMYKTVVICQVVHFMRSYAMGEKTGM